MMTHISYLDQPPFLLHPHWHLSSALAPALVRLCVLAKDTLCAQWVLVKINWSTCLGAATLPFTFTSTLAFTFTLHTQGLDHNSASWACWQWLSRCLWSHIQYLSTGTAFYDLFWHSYDSCSVALLQVLATSVLASFPATAHLPWVQFCFNEPRGVACSFVTPYSVH